MKKAILIIALLITTCTVYSQQKTTLTADNYVAKSPLLVLQTTKDTIRTIYSAMIISLSPNLISSIIILKDSASRVKYGNMAKNGVLVIDFKPEYQFPENELTLDKLLKGKHKKLPVYVDSTNIKFPEMLYITKSEIKSINVGTDQLTGIKFWNVITYNKTYKDGNFKLGDNKSGKNDQPQLKPGEFMIR